MTEIKIKPSYIGNNEDLVFIVPKKLFRMNLSSEEALDRKTANKFSKYLRGTFKGFQEARKTKYGNEKNKKKETSKEFWNSFEHKAKNLGVDLIGYIPVLPDFIFKDLKVYGRNAIILGMEMKWNAIKTAPSINCGIEAFRVYKALGDITIELTEHLKDLGYKSEAHHPFGGKLLFTAHAVKAQLGIMGRNGLVLTPEFGPRQRWSMITTDAKIPSVPKRNFDEMKKYCEKCGACVKNCRGNAAYEKPIQKNEHSKIVTHIDRSKCIDSLLENNYCSLCLKICPQGNPKIIPK